jgi:Reverse transcriptase (RNA-dependent DNA polymerase)
LKSRSAWFGITSIAVSWIKSYLFNRSFYVNVENTKSSLYQLLCGVPEESVLGPLLFILYTTPLSTVISNSSANHHVYADDTQLFLSFSAADFAYNISLLELTISNVYNWMSFNFLSLNYASKIEFLLVGLLQQLSKLSNPIIHLPDNVILSPFHSARNLEVILIVISLSLNTFLMFPNHAFIIFVTSDTFVLLLIIQQPVLLLLLSFILHLTIVILF